MDDVSFEIKSNEKIAKDIYRIVLECESKQHGIKNPGQFVNIKIDGFFLRRPVSVCDWDDKTLTLIYKTVGKGTYAMSGYEKGKVIKVLSPLGNGFEISDTEGKKVLTVGGGVGVPPMYGLCSALVKKGAHVVAVNGFNIAEEVFYTEEFEALGIETKLVTADGSAGEKGLVTDVLKDIGFDYFYACGPDGMLKALDSSIDPAIEGQMSFEERMGCGFGACMGCSCMTKYGSKRICREGPVLRREEIIW